MRTKLSKEEQITGFELKDIRDFSTQSTLDSEIPEEIILSILMDYKKVDAKKVIEQIIYKLQDLSKSESELNKFIQQLIVLSRLRNLHEEIEQKVNDMPITYDIKNDSFYNRGIREGREEGREEKQSQMISKALSQRVLTIEQIAEMAEVSIDYVLSIQSEPGRKRDT